ncbi:hypothetical protein MB14_01325 [Roseivirga ehrenbergii]|uniref:6-bladed beta-propeller n=1 Tax=Roseivirga ehrenbergii (strain DSM 102268 / JCM 13514 / KCTC 12282 / NCIMB 14502 / KMM 6017) TaxID=279360 RepID=A0A150XTR2_ROSEK|nr:6-bladed beta-propeller [Roseivirga ehrenbergii]KYG82064.1 hypothetical protein MB14_01325 [Roseivirga ehrenbergii]
MMLKLRSQLLAISFMLMCMMSCNSVKDESTIVFGELEPEEFSAFLSSSELEVIPLATDEVVIGDFSMARSADNEYFVFSGQEGKVHRFGSSGNFINTIGQIGDGPTEYRSPAGFVVSNDSLVILTYKKGSSLFYYSKQGDFLKSMDFEESSYVSFELTDYGYMFSTGANKVFENKHNLHSRNFKGELISKFYPIIDRAMFSTGANNFGRGENGSLYFEPFNNQVYKVEKDSLIPTHKFDFGDFNLKENAFDSEDPFENYERIMNNGTAFILAYSESENYAYFNIMLQKNPDKPKAFHLLLNKKTGESKLIMSLEETAPAFQFMDGDRLLFLFHEGDMLNLEKGNPGLFGKHQQVIDNIQSDDNPIIVIAKIDF